MLSEEIESKENTSEEPSENTRLTISPNVRSFAYSCPVDHEGTQVRVKGWQVKSSDKPAVVIIHDIGENLNLMRPLAKSFVERGYSTYAFDMRGHERGKKRNNQIHSFNQLIIDFLQVIAWVKYKENGRRPIVIGRGLGGLVALGFAKGHSKYVEAMIFLAPMFELTNRITNFQRFMIRSFSELTPEMKLPNWVCPTFSAIAPRDRQDKGKRQIKLTGKFTIELLNTLAQAKKLLTRLNIPSLFVCPGRDPAKRYENLRKIVAKHENSDKLSYVQLDREFIPARIDSEDDVLVDTVFPWLNDFLINEQSQSKTLEEDQDQSEQERSGQGSSSSEELVSPTSLSKSTEISPG